MEKSQSVTASIRLPLAHHLPSHGTRFSAFLLDRFFVSLFFIPFAFGELLHFLGWLVDPGLRPAMSLPSLLLLAWFASYIYRVAFYFYLGATPGKLLGGLRLVPRDWIPKTDDFGGLSFSQCLVHVFADDLSFFFAFAPSALLFFRLDRTHLSDWISETRVVSLEPQIFVPRRRPVLGSVLLILGLIAGAQTL